MTERLSLPYRVLRFLNDHVMLFPFKKEAMDKLRADPIAAESGFWLIAVCGFLAAWLFLFLPAFDPVPLGLGLIVVCWVLSMLDSA